MSARPDQLVLELPHRQALEAEDFLVSRSNAAAVDLIDAWPNWPHAGAVVAGPLGSGKSHLAHVWQLRSEARVVFGPELQESSIPNPEKRQALVVEDIDRGIGDQKALFHILNLARESRFSVLLTSCVAPGDLQVDLPDLRSRLRALPVVTIDPPDETLLKAVLVKLFHDRQLQVEPHVVNFLSVRMERSMQAANDIVARLDALSLARKRKITRAVAADGLADIQPATGRVLKP